MKQQVHHKLLSIRRKHKQINEQPELREAVYYPTMTPEVVDYRENDDGTFTLTVDVMCFDRKAYPLFTHEVTIRPCENGEFQYLSNNIVYQCGREKPPSLPRLEAQRSGENE